MKKILLNLVIFHTLFFWTLTNCLNYKLGNKPLVVLYSSKNEYPIEIGNLRDSLMNDKIRNQHAFLIISTNSQIISTANSGHEIFLTEPGLVVNAIKRVIISVKKNSKLE